MEERCYVECHFAKCHYTECRGANACTTTIAGIVTDGGEDLRRSGPSSKYTLFEIYHITNLSPITNLSKLETKLGLSLGLSPNT